MDDWLRTPSICYFYIVCIAMISVEGFCGTVFHDSLCYLVVFQKKFLYINMYFYTRLMLALDFAIPISSTSLPGGNLVDGLPPASSLGAVVWGQFFEAVGLIVRATHEEHMERKIIHLAEKKLISTD